MKTIATIGCHNPRLVRRISTPSLLTSCPISAKKISICLAMKNSFLSPRKDYLLQLEFACTSSTRKCRSSFVSPVPLEHKRNGRLKSKEEIQTLYECRCLLHYNCHVCLLFLYYAFFYMTIHSVNIGAMAMYDGLRKFLHHSVRLFMYHTVCSSFPYNAISILVTI